MKISNAAAAALFASAMAISACSQEAEPVAEPAPDGIPGLTIENPRLVLPPVAGNPAAVYFDLSYEGERGLSLRRADVAGAASAALHSYGEYDGKMQMAEAMPIAMTKGTKIAFEPGGYHVMVFGLPEDIEPGGTVEVTLTVSGGDKHSFDAEVRAAGDER